MDNNPASSEGATTIQTASSDSRGLGNRLPTPNPAGPEDPPASGIKIVAVKAATSESSKEQQTTGKKVYQKKDPSVRKNNKGWMAGKRLELFTPMLASWAQREERGWQWSEEKFKSWCNLYHFHFPWPMSDKEEPEALLPYDPKATRPNPEDSLTPEQISERRQHIKATNERLKRWLDYHSAKKAGNVDTNKPKRADDGVFNEFMALCIGVDGKPRQRHAAYAYMDDNWDTGDQLKTKVEAAYNALPAGSNVKLDVNFRYAVARKEFAKLPQEERKKYEAYVKKEGEEAKAKWKTDVEDGPKKDAVSRANAVSHVRPFVGRVNRGVEERTFLRTFTLVGGPMAMYDGNIGAWNICVSKNNYDVPLTFAEWYGADNMTKLLDAFRGYLDTCYSASDRLQVRLPEGSLAAQAAASSGDDSSGVNYRFAADVTSTVGQEETAAPPDDSGGLISMDAEPIVRSAAKGATQRAPAASKRGGAPKRGGQAARKTQGVANSRKAPPRKGKAKKVVQRDLLSDEEEAEEDEEEDEEEDDDGAMDIQSDTESESGESDSGGSDDDIVPKATRKRKIERGTGKDAARAKKPRKQKENEASKSAMEVDKTRVRLNQLALLGLEYVISLGGETHAIDTAEFVRVGREGVASGRINDRFTQLAAKEKENALPKSAGEVEADRVRRNQFALLGLEYVISLGGLTEGIDPAEFEWVGREGVAKGRIHDRFTNAAAGRNEPHGTRAASEASGSGKHDSSGSATVVASAIEGARTGKENTPERSSGQLNGPPTLGAPALTMPAQGRTPMFFSAPLRPRAEQPSMFSGVFGRTLPSRVGRPPFGVQQDEGDMDRARSIPDRRPPLPQAMDVPMLPPPPLPEPILPPPIPAGRPPVPPVMDVPMLPPPPAPEPILPQPIPDAAAMTTDQYQTLRDAAPDWLGKAVDEFSGAKGNAELKPVLALLLEIENQLGYGSKAKETRLPATKRPQIVSRWINLGRTERTGRMQLAQKDTAKFVKSFGEWWNGMQPKWRTRNEDGTWEQGMYGGEWEKLDVSGGPNGFLSVVAALSYWATACAEGQCSYVEWERAKDDVRWMLMGFLTYVQQKAAN